MKDREAVVGRGRAILKIQEGSYGGSICRMSRLDVIWRKIKSILQDRVIHMSFSHINLSDFQIQIMSQPAQKFGIKSSILNLHQIKRHAHNRCLSRSEEPFQILF